MSSPMGDLMVAVTSATFSSCLTISGSTNCSRCCPIRSSFPGYIPPRPAKLLFLFLLLYEPPDAVTFVALRAEASAATRNR